MGIDEYIRGNAQRYHKPEQPAIQLRDPKREELNRYLEERMRLLTTTFNVYQGSNSDVVIHKSNVEEWFYQTRAGSYGSHGMNGGWFTETFGFRGMETRIIEEIKERRGFFKRYDVVTRYYFPEWDISITPFSMETIKKFFSLMRP